MCEISLALVEPYFLQTLAFAVGPSSGGFGEGGFGEGGFGIGSGATPSTITLNPSSPVPATEYLYPGALVVVGWHVTGPSGFGEGGFGEGGFGVGPFGPSPAEVVEVVAVTGPNTFTGVLQNAHAAGESVFSATFPTQQATDPIFTQAEIQGYISQAQNEFLTKVPLIFELFPNEVIQLGNIYQTLPDTAIELERVAIQSTPHSWPILQIVRLNGFVTAYLGNPISGFGDGGFGQGGFGGSGQPGYTPTLSILVFGVTDNSFNSVDNGTFTLVTVSPDGYTVTWQQAGVNTTSAGGTVARPILTRLYESSQNQLAMQNQDWQSNLTGLPPQSFFEDRAGVYGWGVAPPPQGNYYCELLCSIRSGEFLDLLDFFLVPDIFVPYIKYWALAACFSKAGVQRSPSLARWAQSRFDFGVMLADRFLRNSVQKVGR